MSETKSLLELVRGENGKRGRKLIIISDYDDCIQPHKPRILYNIEEPDIPFEEYFNNFWNKAKFITGGDAKRRMSNYSYLFDDFDKNANFSDQVKKKFNLDDKQFEKIRKNRDSHELIKLVKKMDSGFYREGPFLSIAEELLQCLKEDLIEELIIATSHSKGRYTENGDPRKIEKFQKTFGLFPNCKLECIELVKDSEGEARPFRWDWTKENYPNFDIFIDDNQKVIEKTRKIFPPGRVYVLPKYKTNEKTEGVHVKTTVSDLKDEDFAQAAEEYKAQKALETKQKSSEVQPSTEQKNYWPWILGGVAGLVLIVGLVVCFWKSKK